MSQPQYPQLTPEQFQREDGDVDDVRDEKGGDSEEEGCVEGEGMGFDLDTDKDAEIRDDHQGEDLEMGSEKSGKGHEAKSKGKQEDKKVNEKRTKKVEQSTVEMLKTTNI
ncbi:hypothetical protein BBP40_008121 [Aspergillus hancockii]|nr:hypothetical protein BBP40_008121 [Aspergillus hancockii]